MVVSYPFCLRWKFSFINQNSVKLSHLYLWYNTSQQFWLLQGMIHWAMILATCTVMTLQDKLHVHEKLDSVTVPLFSGTYFDKSGPWRQIPKFKRPISNM